MPDTATQQFRTIAAVLAALLLLDIGLTLHNVWPTVGVRWPGDASVDLAWIVLLLSVHGAWRGRLGALLQWGLAALLSFMMLVRYVDITAPALFGRRVDIYWDIPHTPNVVAMLAATMPAWQVIGIAAASLVAVAAIVLLVRWCVGVLDSACARPVGRWSLAALGAVGIAAFNAGMNSDRLTWEHYFAIPVSRVLGEQAMLVAETVLPTGTFSAYTGDPLRDADMAALQGGDVYLVFLESYGAFADSEPDASGAIAAARQSWAASLAASGRSAVTATVDSPTYGGLSWLAHSTLLSGLSITRNGDYHRLLKSGRETLVDRFRTAGYRTVGLVPGVRKAWPEGEALRFDTLYNAASLDYAGPAYGWWQIPDQVALDTLWRREIAPRDRAPLFAFFPTINSHFPFTPVPPYVADWDSLAQSENFPAPPPATEAVSSVSPGDYRRSIAYNLQFITGFVEKRMPDNAVLIVLGDHQPPAVLTGPPQSHAVPIHVISADPAILQPFLAAGFYPGLIPRLPVNGPMATLTPLLLSAFDGDSN